MARRKDQNMVFLKGGVVFFVLIGIVVMFTYFAITQAIAKNYRNMECLVSFSDDFGGENLSFFAEDSLLYKGDPVNPDTSFFVPCFKKEVELFVYTLDSTFVGSTPLEKGGNYKLKYNGGDIKAVKLVY